MFMRPDSGILPARTLTRAVCTENLNTGVVVMKSAKDGA
jgi:hypothetical protein